jgi:hypothetical protein
MHPIHHPAHLDYFTITPLNYDHYSSETPCTTPTEDPIAYSQHPLLAVNNTAPATSPSTDTPSNNLMSMQTAAAHGHVHVHPASRPRPTPVQNVLHVTSDDSDDSATSSPYGSSSFGDMARCSRCQRTPSLDIHTGKSNMVSYGLNLWYCNRCAALVGFKR